MTSIRCPACQRATFNTETGRRSNAGIVGTTQPTPETIVQIRANGPKPFTAGIVLREDRVSAAAPIVHYRMVVKINYPYRVIYVRFVGTHAEYDKIDVEEV